jgi:CBS domain-containing protein
VGVGEADLLRAPEGAMVADAMRRAAPSVPDDAPLSRALAIMAAQRADDLAVVSSDGAVVGVLGAGDVVAWLAGELEWSGEDGRPRAMRR